jgi:hypothetical protein
MRLMKIIAAALLLGCLTGPGRAADEVTVVITIKNHRFEPARPKAPAGVPLLLRITNADSTPEEFESKSLRVERVIAGGSTSVIKVRPLSSGSYTFFGEFNDATAQGTLVIE